MSADLHIHVFEEGELSPADFNCFFANVMGSSWGSIGSGCDEVVCEHHENIMDTEDVWVGEVSWLKGALTKDEDTYVPDPISEVQEAIGEDLPEVNDELINDVKEAFQEENTTQYKLERAEDVIEFLEDHKGKKAFTVSW